MKCLICQKAQAVKYFSAMPVCEGCHAELEDRRRTVQEEHRRMKEMKHD